MEKTGKKRQGKHFNGFINAISRDENEAAASDLKMRMILSIIFLAGQTGAFAIDHEMEIARLAVRAVFLLLLIIVNYGCFTDAFRSISERRPEKNLLAAVGVILAIAILRFVTAGVVLTTMAVCRYLEAYIKLKLHSHLTTLTEIEPSDDGISEGDTVEIGPGEILPVDGEIVRGETAVDEELITGERIPAKKSVGDIVLAGTMNIASDITIKVMRTGGKRTISRIVMHMSRAVMTRSPKTEKYEKIARNFVIIVLAVAAVTGALWLFAEKGVVDASIAAIAILLIANPYAFSVAIPMNVLAAVVRGSEHGILIRSAGILEETRDINTIVVNKRGTVTEGEPEISDVIPLDKSFDLKLAGILEAGADHPYGRLIFKEASKEHGEIPHADITENVEGRGICCTFEGKEYTVGNEAFMNSRNIPVDEKAAGYLFRQGKSLVFFAEEEKVLGMIALRDVPKPANLKAITRMENMGLDVVMLTSDSRKTAEALRSEAGIDHIFADILPSEKKDIVERIRKEKKKIVAMVGDGIYDAKAIEASDLGIAISTGKDINISSADMVLVTDDLLDVVRAMKLSRFSVRNLRQCVAFAYVYNIIAIICATGLFALFTGVTLMPEASALCMCASQALVTLNSLRLKRTRL